MKKLSLLSLSIISTFAAAQTPTGIITDAQSNAVIQNAKITVKGSNTTLRSDKEGAFTLPNAAQGELELHISAENYAHKTVFVQDLNNPIQVSLLRSSIEVIDVKGIPLHASLVESVLPISVMVEDDLRNAQAATLGDTISEEVGIHSTAYAGVASSPIIRGLDGPRVLITQNGLDAGDASRIGADHVIASDTATAQQIEIFRGPATLFYGSGAIGGVVNVIDDRIATDADEELQFNLSQASVNDETAGSLNLKQALGQFVVTANAFYRDAEEYKVPSYSHHDEHEEHAEHDDDDHDDHEEHEEFAEGKVENSQYESSGFTIGASYLLDNGFVGVSFGRLNKEYGIPGHAHGEHEEEDHEEHEEGEHDDHDEHGEENVFADMKQDRVQVLSRFSFDDGWLNAVNAKYSYIDYAHVEIEDDSVGTGFYNETHEAKLDLELRPQGHLRNALSLQYKFQDFAAEGEEAFIPQTDTTMLGLAWLGEYHKGEMLYQFGARVESVDIDAELEDSSLSESFNPVSFSAGVVHDYAPGYNYSIALSNAQRAPSAAELFANGPHIATRTYEVGALFEVELHDGHLDIETHDIDIDIETSKNLELTWRKFSGDLGVIFNVFYNKVDNYLVLDDTGFMSDMIEHHDEDEDHEEHDEMHESEHDDHDESDVHEEHEDHDHGGDLPVYRYTQVDATLSGFEAQVNYQFTPELHSLVQLDYVRARSDNGNLPRTPPMRALFKGTYQTSDYMAQVSLQHVFEQDNVAVEEAQTDAYTLVNANFNYYLDVQNVDLVLYAQVKNVFDEYAQVHTSFLKDEAPLAGRNIKVGIRGQF